MADGNLALDRPTAVPSVAERTTAVKDEQTVLVTRALTGPGALDLPDDLAHVAWDRIRRLDLSLGDVEAVDPSGIAAIVRVYGHLARRGARLRLVDATPEVAASLAEYGLEGVVPILVAE